MAKLATTSAEKSLIDNLSVLDKQVDAPFKQALGMSTSFRNEDAAKVLMTELDPIIQKSLDNLNQLLGQYPGAIGVKTGYTLTAGHTIVAAAERNGRRFIVSVLGSADNFGDATKLLDWAFASAPPSCAKSGTSEVAAR